MRRILSFVCALAAAGAMASCATTPENSAERPRIVVTTNILGDIVTQLVGDAAEVNVIMPIGAAPHDFAPSARQAEDMQRADLLVTNGARFEAAMDKIIAQAVELGTPHFAFADAVELRTVDGAVDPHLWTDPVLVSQASRALGDVIATLPGIDVTAVANATSTYLERLEALDQEIRDVLADVPTQRRVLITNHEVLGYFADRYDFRVVGAVVPSLSTNAEASARQLEALSSEIVGRDIPAIFAETTQSTQLAEALANATGRSVEIVELYTESLGDGDSGADHYLDLMRTDARLIAEALT